VGEMGKSKSSQTQTVAILRGPWARTPVAEVLRKRGIRRLHLSHRRGHQGILLTASHRRKSPENAHHAERTDPRGRPDELLVYDLTEWELDADRSRFKEDARLGSKPDDLGGGSASGNANHSANDGWRQPVG